MVLPYLHIWSLLKNNVITAVVSLSFVLHSVKINRTNFHVMKSLIGKMFKVESAFGTKKIVCIISVFKLLKSTQNCVTMLVWFPQPLTA